MRRLTLVGIAVLFAFSLVATGSADLATWDVLFSEDFNGITATPPQLPNWTIQGELDTSSPTYGASGTARSGDEYWDNDWMDLTPDTDVWQRTSAFYTEDTMLTDYFTITAKVRLQNQSDTDEGMAGMAFCWVDSETVDLSDGASELLGGWGKYYGAPRGGQNNGDVGYYSGLQGNAFVFSNEYISGTGVQDETVEQDLGTWSEVNSDSSADIYDQSWVNVKLENYYGEFTFFWGDNYENTHTWTDPDYTPSMGYFGVTAATSDFCASYEVDDFAVSTPEPGTLLLLLPGAVALYLRKRRDE